MTVVTLLAPFPAAKVRGFSHWGKTEQNKATYLDCSDLPALPGLILSGLLAFFPSPMKWEKSSVCCSRYSNRFSAPAEPEVPAPPA